MIFGRPLALWGTLVAAISASLLVLIVNLVPSVNVTQVTTVLGSLTALVNVILAFIANQPPVLNVGDSYVVTTPSGQPNVTKVANTSVTPTPPPVR